MVMKIKEIEYSISNKAINYEDSVEIMENRVEHISSKIKSELLWFLEHPAIYTAGTSSNEKDLLKKIPSLYSKLLEEANILTTDLVKELFI